MKVAAPMSPFPEMTKLTETNTHSQKYDTTYRFSLASVWISSLRLWTCCSKVVALCSGLVGLSSRATNPCPPPALQACPSTCTTGSEHHGGSRSEPWPFLEISTVELTYNSALYTRFHLIVVLVVVASCFY